MTWASDNIRPASWRGIRFHTEAEDAEWTRATVVHQYPKRETVWVEDLGGGKNPIALSGFLEGDDVLDQLAAMVAAAQRPGPGELIHPTLGRRTVTCVGFGSATQWDQGRKVALKFTFIESGPRIYPSPAANTRRATTEGADALDAASKAQFTSSVAGPLAAGGAVKGQIADVSGGWVAQAVALAGDARRVVRSAGALVAAVGGFGRFFRGWRGQARAFPVRSSTTASVAQVAAAVTAGGKAIGTATGTLDGVLKAANQARAAVSQAGALVGRIGALF